MVRNAYREGSTGHVTVALTTAGCPLRATIKRDCETRVVGLPGITNVRLHWDELNAAEKARVMKRARRTARDSATPSQVPASARVLAVASGKGGVGKSSVTVNLATALASRGFVVGVMDADIWGFSVPRMLGMEGRLGARPPAEGEQRGKILPEERPAGAGLLKVVSTGLLVENEETALMWRGLMLAKAVEQFLHDVDWGELDYMLIDMPPGTGDVQMALARLLPQAEMLVVTTPALSAQKVAVRVADMARRSHMPILGVVENMGAFVALTDSVGRSSARGAASAWPPIWVCRCWARFPWNPPCPPAATLASPLPAMVPAGLLLMCSSELPSCWSPRFARRWIWVPAPPAWTAQSPSRLVLVVARAWTASAHQWQIPPLGTHRLAEGFLLPASLAQTDRLAEAQLHSSPSRRAWWKVSSGQTSIPSSVRKARRPR